MSATIGRKQDTRRKRSCCCKLLLNKVLQVPMLGCRVVLAIRRRLPALAHPGSPPMGRAHSSTPASEAG